MTTNIRLARRCLIAWTSLLIVPLVCGATTPSAVIEDPPRDAGHPASIEVVHIPTHGLRINGVLYLAAGAPPHPVAILFHGMAGNEQNLDLAQAVRRAGWSVLTLHYRGSWGSPGTYSYHHLLEDGLAAVAFVRNEHNAEQYGLDRRRIVLAGHSSGGFVAALTAAATPDIAGLILISASDDAGEARIARRTPAAWRQFVKEAYADSMETLTGCTPEGLALEALKNADGWSFASNASRLVGRPLLSITSDDGLAAEGQALVDTIDHASQPGLVTHLHLNTDHSFSDHRIALQAAVVSWLQERFPLEP